MRSNTTVPISRLRNYISRFFPSFLFFFPFFNTLMRFFFSTNSGGTEYGRNRNSRVEEDTGTGNYQFLVLSIDFFFSLSRNVITRTQRLYIYMCICICIYINAGTATIHWKFVFYRPVITNVMQNYVESSSFPGIQDIIWYQVRVNPAPGATFRYHDLTEKVSFRLGKIDYTIVMRYRE